MLTLRSQPVYVRWNGSDSGPIGITSQDLAYLRVDGRLIGVRFVGKRQELWITATGRLDDAKGRGRIAVAAVGPGIDLRHQSEKGLRIDRENGKLYCECWEGALMAAPDWVLVESFNHWEIGTEIEPSVQFGDQYLKLTAEYAARFKAGQGSPAPK